jgi:hypothetical protein
MAFNIAEPLPYTLLAPARYAQILSVNPVHFQGAVGITVFPIRGGDSNNRANDLWPRYSWQQSDHVSMEDLSRAIYDAEQDIARELGWYPAPWYVSEEIQQFPRHYRPDVFRWGGRNVRGMRASVITDFAKVIAGGRRDVDLIGTANVAAVVAPGTIVYSDEDGDGFNETATITLTTTYGAAFARYFKVYHADYDGDQAWEIRPARSKSITGTTWTGVFSSWLFVNPDTQGRYPTDEGWSGIDIQTDDSNFVTSVEVYYEYVDNAQVSAEFYWEPCPTHAILSSVCVCCGGTGCEACTHDTQTGCLHVRDAERGIVVPQPANYDSDDSEWDQSTFTYCRDPEFVKLWYYAGEYEDRFLNGTLLDPLSDYWAHAIAWLATTKLERPFCSGGNVTALAERLREDLSFSGAGGAYQADPAALANPFGPQRGAIMAWQRVTKFALHRRARPGLI